MTDYEDTKNLNADANVEKQNDGDEVENEEQEYEVGYRKPPKHTQFEKGRSGNSKGRPKGTKNLLTDFEEELREQIIIGEGGSPKRISKQRVIVKSLVAKAAKGDTRAAAKVFDMVNRAIGVDTADEDEGEVGAEDQAIIDAHIVRVLRRADTNMLQDTYEYLVPPESRSSAVNPENVLEEVIRSKENELRDQRVLIRLVCPSPLPVVRIDLTQFHRALGRVIEFSCALLNHGGKLEIQAGITQIGSEQYVELKIASISPTPIEVEEKDVFQPFLRVNRHQAGLSIPLARDILKRYQGKITFRMEKPKQGLFVILLKVR